jgi:hypothetical protein
MKLIIYIKYIFYYKFKIIRTIEQAKEMKLTLSHNVYGDFINRYNCRSIWKDKYGLEYRCAEYHSKFNPKS